KPCLRNSSTECALRSHDGERYPRAYWPEMRLIAALARTSSASSSSREYADGDTCFQPWCAISCPASTTAFTAYSNGSAEHAARQFAIIRLPTLFSSPSK